MKILKLARLGNKSILAHKKRVFLTTVVLGALFSILVAAAFIIQGIENNLISASLYKTDGKVLMYSSICHGTYIDDENGSCETPETYDKIASEKAKKYHGEHIGAVITYTNEAGGMIRVIPEKATKYIDSEPFYSAPADKLPALVSADRDNVTTKNDVLKDDELHVLGTFPAQGMYVKTAKRNNEFNLIDGFIRASGSSGDSFIIFDTEKVMNYLIANGYKMYYYGPLFEFDKFDDAFLFYKNENCNGGESCDTFTITELFAGSVKIRENYERLYGAMNFAMAVLIVVALVIVLFTFVRIINDEAKTIALYRSLGATGKDIFLIYLCELFEFSLFTILFAFLVGGGIALLVSGNYSELLSKSINKNFGFNFSITPLIGFNFYHILIALSILALAPLSAILSLDKLSTKNIAKKLKQ